MAEILHFDTHTQTNKHTDMGITIPRPPPMGGEVTMGGVKITKYELDEYDLLLMNKSRFLIFGIFIAKCISLI